LEHLPTTRDFRIALTGDPNIVTLVYAGVEVTVPVSAACVAEADPQRYEQGADKGSLSLTATVSGDRLDAVIDLGLANLPVGEVCDVRYALVGQRAVATTGNPTGEPCGMGVDCTYELCAYGHASACAFDVCVASHTVDGDDSYCSEPCEIGSCPAGFECRDVGTEVEGSTEHWFCVRYEPVCGDGNLEGAEVCDDGNTGDGDGCSQTCRSNETCGNDILDGAVGEKCEDGNSVGGDGCSAYCTVEACSNGVLDVGELCDDGNLVAGDGCSALCWLESCGNGRVDPGEGCDDGNLVNTDSCDGFCRVRLLRGTARLDAQWVHALPFGMPTRVLPPVALAMASRALYLWTEEYDGTGPFEHARESFSSFKDGTDDFVSPPHRQEALAGFKVESLVALPSRAAMALLSDGSTLLVSQSTDGGARFAAPMTIQIPALPALQEAGRVARLYAEGRRLFLLLAAPELGANGRTLFMSHSDDSGATWSTALRLSLEGEHGDASAPVVYTAPSGQLAIAWADGAEGARELRVLRSRDAGETLLRLNENVGALDADATPGVSFAVAPCAADLCLVFAGPAGVQLGRWDGQGTPWRLTSVVSADRFVGVHGPVAMASTIDGVLAVGFVAQNAAWAMTSTNGVSFTAPTRVGLLPPELTTLYTGPLAVAWDRDLATETSTRLVVLWLADLQVGEQHGFTPLAVVSPDAGANFSEVGTPLIGAAAATNVDAPPLVALAVAGEEQWLSNTGTGLWLHEAGRLQLAPPATPAPGVAGSNCPAALADGGWCSPASIGAPSARRGASLVWTGIEAILFGGSDGYAALADGGAYNPVTDSWRPLDASVAAVGLWGRVGHTAVWTGSEMLVFGGNDGEATFADGVRYDPITDRWTLLPATDAPAARSHHGAVWTGVEMIVLGGHDAQGQVAGGGRYNPSTGHWIALPALPFSASDAAVTWTGAEVVVFGGRSGSSLLAQGFRYRPGDNSVVTINAVGAPSARTQMSSTWIGTELLVWGGLGATGVVGTGASYNPTADSWSALPLADAPSPRRGQVASFTGEYWLVWGGTQDATGAVLLPGAPAWTSMSELRAPTPRSEAAAAWLGDRWLVVGGVADDGEFLSDGGLFVP